MKYIMNELMVDIMRKTPYKRIVLPKKLLAILEDGIVEINNCLFFRFLQRESSPNIQSIRR